MTNSMLCSITTKDRPVLAVIGHQPLFQPGEHRQIHSASRFVQKNEASAPP